MLPSQLARLDLNALQALVVVEDCQSFSEASTRLEVNQSTISYAIKRLREAFNDPIFVRQGNSIVATDKCRQLALEARSILERINVLASPETFQPASAHGHITLSCNHHERMFLIPGFLHRLLKQAPNVRVDILESAVDGQQQLKQNLSDIVIGPVSILGEIYYRRKMFVDHYACVMDPAHPLTRGEITLERYCRTRHIAVTHNGRWEALYFPVLRARNAVITPTVTVPSHDNLEPLIRGTDLVATIPYRLARHLSKTLSLRPFPEEVRIQIEMYWTERTHYSGLHRWVRQVLADVARNELGVAPEVFDEVGKSV